MHFPKSSNDSSLLTLHLRNTGKNDHPTDTFVQCLKKPRNTKVSTDYLSYYVIDIIDMLLSLLLNF